MQPDLKYINMGKMPCALGLEELILLKWPYYPKQSTKCNVIPYQITHGIFHRNRTNNPKPYMKPQKTPNHPSNPEEKRLRWGITLSDLRLNTNP